MNKQTTVLRAGVALLAISLCVGGSGCEKWPVLNGGLPDERHDWVVPADISGNWLDPTEKFVCDGYVVNGREFAINQSGDQVEGTFSETYAGMPKFYSVVHGTYDRTTGVLTLNYEERVEDCFDLAHYQVRPTTEQFKFTSDTEMNWVDSDRPYEVFQKL